MKRHEEYSVSHNRSNVLMRMGLYCYFVHFLKKIFLFTNSALSIIDRKHSSYLTQTIEQFSCLSVQYQQRTLSCLVLYFFLHHFLKCYSLCKIIFATFDLFINLFTTYEMPQQQIDFMKLQHSLRNTDKLSFVMGTNDCVICLKDVYHTQRTETLQARYSS